MSKDTFGILLLVGLLVGGAIIAVFVLNHALNSCVKSIAYSNVDL